MEAGRPADVIPCGLAARDTLRLEAAMRLYGNDIDETTTVLEADLGWIVGWSKPSFVGHERLREQKASGLARKLAGFEMIDRGIARHGHAVVRDGSPVGVVTSGTQTPFLKKAIGMAYVPASVPGDAEVAIEIRNRRVPARLVPLPFYKRPRK
jgi:aminomethyltransferase